MYNRFENWQQWKYYYREQLKHPAGFEEMFVDKVLSQVAGLTPSDVIPQYHFVDDAGGNRYIDFMVLNEAKGYHLAIELDGLTKIQNGYNTLDYVRYQDMWVRQNALMRTGAVLLRFTNKDMFQRVGWVIQSVVDTLASQNKQYTTQQGLIQGYQTQIQALKNQATVTQQMKDTVAMLQEQVTQLQVKQSNESTKELDTQEWVMKPIPSVSEIQDEYAREEQKRLAATSNANATVTTKQGSSYRWVWVILAVVIAIFGYFVLSDDYVTAEEYIPPTPTTTAHEPYTTYVPVDNEVLPITQEPVSEYKAEQEHIQPPTTKPSSELPILADLGPIPTHDRSGRIENIERMDKEGYSERGTLTQMPDETRADRDRGY
ncbi:hypothetical protein C0208_01605 [Moraxella catarrhalis]|uniref:hypothetical protein n=1 Tax=Moraxella catarrhalis TaxID=480 RepID=UPI00128D506E|nr:hypothetical protein [Moraxella catarrhalis]MPW63521.1 hypothetical protein [Moraxella catarrhalis]